uniref:Uncharacterized protein n=1 Tax=Anguilla anguilla TaxID=7936 RepID=A0A0E9X2G5_ANGAN
MQNICMPFVTIDKNGNQLKYILKRISARTAHEAVLMLIHFCLNKVSSAGTEPHATHTTSHGSVKHRRSECSGNIGMPCAPYQMLWPTKTQTFNTFLQQSHTLSTQTEDPESKFVFQHKDHLKCAG